MVYEAWGGVGRVRGVMGRVFVAIAAILGTGCSDVGVRLPGRLQVGGAGSSGVLGLT